MGILEIFFIIVGGIALLIALAAIIRRVSVFFRERYNFSIWAGVLLIVIAFAIAGYSYAHYGEINTPYMGVALAIILLTAFLDFRHAGVGMGLLALLIEIILSAFFVLVLLLALVYLAIRAFRRGDDWIVDRVTGTSSGARAAMALFFRFFIP